MEQVAAVAKILADRLAAVFSVLDLSFFVAGGVCLLALTFLTLGIDPHAGQSLPPALIGIAGILLSYACGLVSMALGRHARRGPIRSLNALLFRCFPKRWPAPPSVGHALATHLATFHLHQHPFFAHHFAGVALVQDEKEPLKGWTPAHGAAFRRVYARIWGLLRQEPRLAPSLEQLNAMWVRSAVMDGLAASFIVWAVVPWAVHAAAPEGSGIGHALHQIGPCGIVIFDLFLLLGSVTMIAEARRTEESLVEEIVGTMAWHLQDKPPDPPATGTPS